MKRRDFNSFDEFHESGTAGNYEEVTVIHENGWVKSDLLTECKSWKTVLRRFFKMLGNDGIFEGWKETIEESIENGFFTMNDFTLSDGSKNPFPGYAFEVEEIDENVWYIFLNLKESTDEENEVKEDEEMKEIKKEDENRTYCKNISDTLEKIVDGSMYRCPECGNLIEWDNNRYDEEKQLYSCPECGKTFEEYELESAGVLDYFENVLDIEYRIGSDREFRSVRLLVAYGGPNVYVDTGCGKVQLYWWNEYADYMLSSDTIDAINETFEELYNC